MELNLCSFSAAVLHYRSSTSNFLSEFTCTSESEFTCTAEFIDPTILFSKVWLSFCKSLGVFWHFVIWPPSHFPLLHFLQRPLWEVESATVQVSPCPLLLQVSWGETSPSAQKSISDRCLQTSLCSKMKYFQISFILVSHFLLRVQRYSHGARPVQKFICDRCLQFLSWTNILQFNISYFVLFVETSPSCQNCIHDKYLLS